MSATSRPSAGWSTASPRPTRRPKSPAPCGRRRSAPAAPCWKPSRTWPGAARERQLRLLLLAGRLGRQRILSAAVRRLGEVGRGDGRRRLAPSQGAGAGGGLDARAPGLGEGDAGDGRSVGAADAGASGGMMHLHHKWLGMADAFDSMASVGARLRVHAQAALARLARGEPPVDFIAGPATPHELVEDGPLARLLHYRARGAAQPTPIVIVASLINRYYVLDLLPELSVIDQLCRHGFDVF